jgi:hypothetical protein
VVVLAVSTAVLLPAWEDQPLTISYLVLVRSVQAVAAAMAAGRYLGWEVEVRGSEVVLISILLLEEADRMAHHR